MLLTIIIKLLKINVNKNEWKENKKGVLTKYAKIHDGIKIKQWYENVQLNQRDYVTLLSLKTGHER